MLFATSVLVIAALGTLPGTRILSASPLKVLLQRRVLQAYLALRASNCRGFRRHSWANPQTLRRQYLRPQTRRLPPRSPLREFKFRSLRLPIREVNRSSNRRRRQQCRIRRGDKQQFKIRPKRDSDRRPWARLLRPLRLSHKLFYVSRLPRQRLRLRCRRRPPWAACYALRA